MKESCGNCRFYSIDGCKRYPPPEARYVYGERRWPEVFRDDWCGEWKARQPSSDAATGERG